MSDETIRHVQRIARIGSAGLLFIACLMALAVKARRGHDLQGQLPEGPATGYQQHSGVRSVGVKVRQLDPVRGIVPVTLDCEDAKVMGAGTITQLPCTLQNNSSVAMVAGTVHVLTTINVNDKEDFLSSYETFDMALHSDFRDENKNHLVRPGMVYRFDVTPVDYGNVVIKGFFVEIDYLEFVDRSFVGPNRVGSWTIRDIRNGAIKYKDWLIKQSKTKALSLKAIADVLDNDVIPSAEIGLENSDENSGANMYRKYARRVYRATPSDDFLKRLLTPN
jgi:hypothetical protein